MERQNAGGKQQVPGSPTGMQTGGKDQVLVSPTDTQTVAADDDLTTQAGNAQIEDSQAEFQTDQREPYIPRERFDTVLNELNALRQEISSQRTQGDVAWNQVTDEQLNYVVTHPLEYPQHAHLAMQEKERRMETRILQKANQQVTLQQFRSQHPEMFNPASPIGKEVAKILNTSDHYEILNAATELAQYRVNKGATASKARKTVVNNLKNATTAATLHGQESREENTPSYMDMSDDEFENELNKLKLINRI